MDKSWVWLPRASIEYEEGACAIVYASAKKLGNPLQLFCPCIDCRNVCHQDLNTVLDHLVIRGMDQKYKRNACWSIHGEITSEKTTDDQHADLEAYELFRSAFFDNEDNTQTSNKNGEHPEVVESEEESMFKQKLEDAETPLYSNCPNYTKVAAIMGLCRIKVKSGISENYFDQLLSMVHDMLPEGNVLPTSTSEIKKFLKIFGFGYDVIHACKNDCILYRKQYEEMSSCPRCGASRWELDKHSGEIKNGIPAKVLSNASEDGTMRHPVDSLTWAQVNAKWPQFAADPRNLRLGISTDGMNPFSIQNTKYSTWPVLLVNYNMPPTMCMKSENIMVSKYMTHYPRRISHLDGRPVRQEFEETIEKIKSIDSEMESTASMCVKEDVVTQVLGKDKPVRIRGMGRRITATKLAFMQARDSHVQEVVRGLQDAVRGLAASKSKLPDDVSNNSKVGDLCKGGPRCQILDWSSPDDIVIGEGEFCSAEPTYKIGRIPVGRYAGAILVKSVIDEDAFVWRPTTTINKLGQAIGVKIAWQLDKLILDEEDSSAHNKTAASSANTVQASRDDIISKSKSPGSASNSSNTSKNEKKKCILLDCKGFGQKVAEGRVFSTNPEDVVHFVPLGHNASKVWVDVSTIGDAPVGEKIQNLKSLLMLWVV